MKTLNFCGGCGCQINPEDIMCMHCGTPHAAPSGHAAGENCASASGWPCLDDLRPALEFAELGREWALEARDGKTYDVWNNLVEALRKALIYGGADRPDRANGEVSRRPDNGE